jgi:EAL domain-containing protein (putative c-di-GMP-specific phosphodiesterase class I)/membrane protein implicated in regulation of membrane protease activity
MNSHTAPTSLFTWKPIDIAGVASPYLAALGMGLLIAMMIATMSLTAFERQWIVFLSGFLAAAVFALVSHTTSARWSLARRTAQLASMRAKLAEESRLRAAAEASLARAYASMELLAHTPVEPDDARPPTAAQRLVVALERDEFSLYSQAIVPLGAAGDGASFCEVLLRLKEEEDNLLPPGSFLPIAEEHGLLPSIDRWVVRSVLKLAASNAHGSDAVYFVNVCSATVTEGTLAAFVREQLALHRLGGMTLCLEFPEADAVANPASYRELIEGLAGSGCRFAATGIGRDPASVKFFKEMRVKYLKLDGAMALGVLRNPLELARVKAINESAHAAGMQVVAQCVEDDRTRFALQAAGTDFAQGFGIAMPAPMQASR